MLPRRCPPAWYGRHVVIEHLRIVNRDGLNSQFFQVAQFSRRATTATIKTVLVACGQYDHSQLQFSLQTETTSFRRLPGPLQHLACFIPWHMYDRCQRFHSALDGTITLRCWSRYIKEAHALIHLIISRSVQPLVMCPCS